MRKHKADIGIALDGDADRLLMADDKGALYDGDQLLYVVARDVQRERAPTAAGLDDGFAVAFDLHGSRSALAFPVTDTDALARWPMRSANIGPRLWPRAQWHLPGACSCFSSCFICCI